MKTYRVYLERQYEFVDLLADYTSVNDGNLSLLKKREGTNNWPETVAYFPCGSYLFAIDGEPVTLERKDEARP